MVSNREITREENMMHITMQKEVAFLIDRYTIYGLSKDSCVESVLHFCLTNYLVFLQMNGTQEDSALSDFIQLFGLSWEKAREERNRREGKG